MWIKHTHTQIQTHTHTLRCEPISQLTAFLIQRVITGCQLSSHCLYFKPERNKADHIWTWSSEIYSTQPGHELHCNHLHDRKAPRFPQKHPHKWSSAQSPAAAAAAAAANTAGLGRRSPSASATLTSVVYDDTKVRVGGFVLRSFGGSGDDRRLGGILVGGGALLWSRKKKKKGKAGDKKNKARQVFRAISSTESGTRSGSGCRLGNLKFLLVFPELFWVFIRARFQVSTWQLCSYQGLQGF